MPKLISLNEQYKEKGLVIIFVGYESRAKLEPFAQRYKVTWPVAIDPSKKTHDAYGVKAYPTTFLIAPSGKIAWQGHHINDKFMETLKALLPKVKKGTAGGSDEDPTKLTLKEGICERLQLAVRKASRGDLGGALRLAETVLNDDKAKDEEKADAKYVKEEIEKLTAGLFAEAERLLKEKLPYEAKELLIKVRRAYAGTDSARKAQEKITLIGADEELADGLKAGELFAKALKHEEKGRDTNAQKYYRQILESYPGTAYAKKATEKLK